MDASLIVVLFLVGICPDWWPRRWPPIPPPPPPPWWWVRLAIGGVGGVIGGWAFAQVLGSDLATDAGTLIGIAGAFVGSVIIGGVADLLMGSRTAA